MSSEDLKVVGTDIPLREARDKVTGRTRYVDDMKSDIAVKILGSPHPHALIKHIDTRKAVELKGVKAVLTYKDVPDTHIHSLCHRPVPVMERQLRHVGDYVAVVAATTEAIAETALELIDVEYERLPAVFDPEAALESEAPRLYPAGNDYAATEGFPLGMGNELGNLTGWGDVESGFREADVLVEDHYHVTPQIHSALETHVCMARWKEHELTVWCACQCPWELRMILAEYFEFPESRIIIKTPNIGGAFGGKYTERYQFITCLIAQKLRGKTVKLNFTREESQRTVRRPSGRLYAKIGAKADGTITAIDLKALFDIGAYGNYICGCTGWHCEGALLSYRTENARFDANDVHTNHFRSECTRGVHVPFVSYAIESTVDQLAKKLGMDPVAIRLKNMPRAGEIMPPGGYVENPHGFRDGKLDLYPGKEVMDKVLSQIEWKKKCKEFGKPYEIDGPKRKAVGMAYCMGYGGYWLECSTSVKVSLGPDGSATIFSGAQEIGQGINTTLCMIAAEALGISPEEVNIVTGDTRSGVFDFCNSRSSHQLTTNGKVLVAAIEDAKDKLRSMAAPILDAAAEDIEIEGKKVFVKGDLKRSIPLQQLFQGFPSEEFGFVDGPWGKLNASVIGVAAGEPGTIIPLLKGNYKVMQPMVVAADVEVDMDTGIVTPLKLVNGSFPGRVVNSEVVRGQLLGGAAQTLGMALWEELKYDEATSAYSSDDFSDYKIPRVLDMPPIDVVMVEQVDENISVREGLAYGARGVGEMAAWGIVAVANAVCNATGKRIKKSPLTAETVLEMLSKGDD